MLLLLLVVMIVLYTAAEPCAMAAVCCQLLHCGLLTLILICNITINLASAQATTTTAQHGSASTASVP